MRHKNRVWIMGLAGVLCLAPFAMAGEISPKELVEKQLRPQGNEMGVPEPGTVKDIEDTRKQPDPAQMHSPESSRQMTLGGAQYFVEGEILKIDGQNYDIRKADSGEQVRLVVNTDTNLDCAAAPSTGEKSEAIVGKQLTPKQQAPQASQQQLAQGQRKDETARGAGFRIGQCDFHPGDHVKAEVDDMGRVSTLKYLASAPPSSAPATGTSAGTGELAFPGRQEKAGQLDMTGAGGTVPKDYTVLPVPSGGFEVAKGNLLLRKPIYDPQKNTIVGRLENLLMDTHTGHIEYAVILLEGGTHLHPVPWSAIQLKRDHQGELTMVIDTSKYQLMPGMTLNDARDLSPSIRQIVQDMQILRDREPRKAPQREGLGVTQQPASAGPMGEEQVGEGGPSGTRALPPGKAPGFKEEGKKGD